MPAPRGGKTRITGFSFSPERGCGVAELDIVERAYSLNSNSYTEDEKNIQFYEGTRKLQNLGLSVPPELHMFETFLNWGRVAVDWIENRQDVRTILSPDSDTSDPALMEHWDSNNLDAEISLFNRDKLVFGRSFLCVGAKEDDPDHPLITVESPREMQMKVDPRRRRAEYAVRFYGETESPAGVTNAEYATVYLPDSTAWLERTVGGKWTVVERDDHRLGRVPVVMSLNRRRTGVWTGETELTDIIPLIVAGTRTMTALQWAQEVMAVPRRGVLGASKGDFVDPNTNQPLDTWKLYSGAVWALANKDAKTFQFDAASLDNFHDTIRLYAQQASTVTGIPVKAFGQHTANPAAEGAVRAEENDGVKRVERQNADSGTAIGWAMSIAERLRTGEWMNGNRVKVEWHDPATPTFAQRADALQKLHGGGAIISREGAWDELGWSEARKARERAYFDAEMSDPYLDRLGMKERDASTGSAGLPPGADEGA